MNKSEELFCDVMCVMRKWLAGHTWANCGSSEISRRELRKSSCKLAYFPLLTKQNDTNS